MLELCNGNILLFYAYDIGDDIALDVIKERGLLATSTLHASGYFKHYNSPLSFRLSTGYDNPAYTHKEDSEENASSVLFDTEQLADKQLEEAHGLSSSCVVSRLYHFGVLSLCYRVPFEGTLDELKSVIISIKKTVDEQALRDARRCFNLIESTINAPHFYNEYNSYFAIQIHPQAEHGISAAQFKEHFGGKIASLLKLEEQALSDYQKDRILASTIGYYGEDWIIIDSEGSFIYDDEYFEPLEFLESINVQKLELHYFDRLLDHKLQFFYSQKYDTMPWTAYIPLMQEYRESSVYRLAKLRVDISVITEQLENSIKLADDSYYAHMYHLLVEKLSIKEWRESINRKLSIIQDLYRVYQDRLDTIHDQLLTLVIIILIAVETLLFIYAR